MHAELQALLPPLARACRDVSTDVLAIYRRDPRQGLESKSDESPVTAADRLAHERLLALLGALTPDWPVVSEEGSHERPATERFWLVDPLDGTREFLRRNDQFSINLALVEGDRPILGLLHGPVAGHSWGGVVGDGAWHFAPAGVTQPLAPRRLTESKRSLLILTSRSQGEETMQRCRAALAAHHPGCREEPMGSALKFARLAAGEADLYPRVTPTRAWDTAAGQALLDACGGRLMGLDGQPLRYGPADGWLNPGFLAVADGSSDWGYLLEALRG
jgi:3'(2'), 5'-bisphosphate nucleotidase